MLNQVRARARAGVGGALVTLRVAERDDSRSWELCVKFLRGDVEASVKDIPACSYPWRCCGEREG